ncbi:MAG: septum formation family protein [Acidimicrobiales bacterium]
MSTVHRRAGMIGVAGVIGVVGVGCTGGETADGIPDELAYVTTSSVVESTTTTEAALGLRVGDCLAEAPAIGATAAAVGDQVTASCDGDHGAEIYYAFDLPEGAFPQGGAIDELGHDGCYATFEPFVGSAYELSSLVFRVALPDEAAWQDGDREVLCVLSKLDGSPLTAPARNSGL